MGRQKAKPYAGSLHLSRPQPSASPTFHGLFGAPPSLSTHLCHLGLAQLQRSFLFYEAALLGSKRCLTSGHLRRLRQGPVCLRLAGLELLPQVVQGRTLTLQMLPLPPQLLRLRRQLPGPLLGLCLCRAGALQPRCQLLLLLAHPGTLRLGTRCLLPRRRQGGSRLLFCNLDALLLLLQSQSVRYQLRLRLLQLRLQRCGTLIPGSHGGKKSKAAFVSYKEAMGEAIYVLRD